MEEGKDHRDGGGDPPPQRDPAGGPACLVFKHPSQALQEKALGAGRADC